MVAALDDSLATGYSYPGVIFSGMKKDISQDPINRERENRVGCVYELKAVIGCCFVLAARRRPGCLGRGRPAGAELLF